MDWKQIFNVQGLNFWLLASGIGLNVIFTYGTMVFLIALLESNLSLMQAAFILFTFLGTFFTGWLTGKLAHDNRGPSYGVISSLGSVGLLFYILIPSGGLLGIMIIVIALAGGLNGGLMSMTRYKD